MDLSPIMPSYKSARVTFRSQHSRKLITIEKNSLFPIREFPRLFSSTNPATKFHLLYQAYTTVLESTSESCQ
jgi:hypothetical protein